MNSKKPERVFAFIDSQNLNLGVQKAGFKMDWRKFRQWLSDQYDVSKAYMFIGYVPEFESLYQQMHDAGYMVVLKPTFDMTKPYLEKSYSRLDGMQGKGEQRTEAHKEYIEGAAQSLTPHSAKSTGSISGSAAEPDSAARMTKGNIDADLVLWAMKEMSNYEKAIIVSGDGDFYTLIEYLEGKKRLKKLLTPNRYYSNLFNKFEEYIERLDNHRGELRYHDHRRRKQP